jgi:NADH-quinone oxidoreductase E subunit
MIDIKKNDMTTEIEELIGKYGQNREALLPVLQDLQITHGHISDFAQQEIARILGIHPVEVYGVVTFYSFLSTEPKGRHVIRLCQTISCDMANKEAIAHLLEKELGIEFGETTKDKKFTLEFTNCIGMCDQGPAMLINDQVFTKLTPHKVVDILKNFK